MKEENVERAGVTALVAEYPIGVVSRLTGIAAGTLRMWERRYAVAEPSRGEKQNRQYSRADVERLCLMKKLVDKGHPPSSVAKLTTEDMNNLLMSTQGLTAKAEFSQPVTAVTVGERFIEHSSTLGKYVSTSHNYKTLSDISVSTDDLTAQVILIEIPTLQPTSGDEVRKAMSTCRAGGAIVLFRIATKRTLNLLEQTGIVCLRDPVSDERLGRTCQDVCRGHTIPSDNSGNNEISENLFTYDQLHQIAAMSPAIKCECPHHLADLITSLNAFEKYSKECIDANPLDTSIHEDLRITSGRSRLLLEQALKRLLKAENIVLR